MSTDLSALIAAHQWYALAAIAVGLLIRLLKDDTKLPTLPAKWRPWLVVAAGVIAAVVSKLQGGASLKDAIVNGAIVGLLPIVAHQLGVESLLGGKEVPLPSALLVKPADGPKPPIVPPLAMLCLLGALISGCSWFTPARGAAAADLAGCVFQHWGEPPEQIAVECSADIVDVVAVQKAATKYGVTPKCGAP